ncbi:MAG: subclass B1 metallo-beta-lactamase [Bacteroidota bacterium]
MKLTLPNSIVLIVLFSVLSMGELNAQNTVIEINPNLRLIRISDHTFIHESFSQSETYGRLGSNGMILVENGRAFIFDTPMIDSVTRQLLSYLRDSLKHTIAGFITNDWHGDSMGGLQHIIDAGIPSYAHEMTRTIAREKNLPVPKKGFTDSATIMFGSYEIVCRYFGAAHTMDNIVVWIPKEKILFVDCMVKEMKSRDLGYTDDGDLKEYPKTLKKIRDAFPDAKVVVPGHGTYGGIELIDHTIDLTAK